MKNQNVTKPIIDLIAETNLPLARVFKDTPLDKLSESIQAIFVEAYAEGEDEEATRIFRWYHACERERLPDGIKHHAPSTAAFLLSYDLTPGAGLWKSPGMMLKTKAALANALAVGGMEAVTEEGASEYFQILYMNFQDPCNQKIILDALKAATGKDAKRERILQFIGWERLPEEMHRVLMNAWVRNSGDAQLAVAIELSKHLEGCSEEAMSLVRDAVERAKILDRRWSAFKEAFESLGMLRDGTRGVARDYPRGRIMARVYLIDLTDTPRSKFEDLYDRYVRAVKIWTDREQGLTAELEFMVMSSENATLFLKRQKFE